MAKRHVTLLEQIEDDALHGRPIADTLRRAVILGGQAHSTRLRDWATKELKGYNPGEELPAYRRVDAGLCVDGVIGNGLVGTARITGERISTLALPDFAQEAVTESVPISYGIGQVEGLIQERVGKGEVSVKLQPPGAADLVLYMNANSGEPLRQITALYWDVSLSSLRGVVDQVRTVLAELVAEMRAGTPQDQTLPTSAVADQAVNVAVWGDHARVVVTAQGSGGDSIMTDSSHQGGEEGRWWTTWRRLGAATVGLASIVGVVISYLALRA